MDPSSAASTEDLGALALGKLTRVLGQERGARVYQETLRALRVEGLATADELHRFAAALSQRGGMEAAIGGLLGVAATLRGAGRSLGQPT